MPVFRPGISKTVLVLSLFSGGSSGAPVRKICTCQSTCQGLRTRRFVAFPFSLRPPGSLSGRRGAHTNARISFRFVAKGLPTPPFPGGHLLSFCSWGALRAPPPGEPFRPFCSYEVLIPTPPRCHFPSFSFRLPSDHRAAGLRKQQHLRNCQSAGRGPKDCTCKSCGRGFPKTMFSHLPVFSSSSGGFLGEPGAHKHTHSPVQKLCTCQSTSRGCRRRRFLTSPASLRPPVALPGRHTQTHEFHFVWQLGDLLLTL